VDALQRAGLAIVGIPLRNLMEIRPGTKHPVYAVKDAYLLTGIFFKGEKGVPQLSRCWRVDGIPPVLPIDRDGRDAVGGGADPDSVRLGVHINKWAFF
jgi:hypothetical protein